MSNKQNYVMRELSTIELDQVSGGCPCDSRTCWVHRDGTPSWLYYDCSGGAHNIHNP
jgi:hypothetical protein